MPRLARLLAVLLALAAALLMTGTAHAEQPGRLTQPVTDSAGVLGGDPAPTPPRVPQTTIRSWTTDRRHRS